VVAADDGVVPQTPKYAAVLGALGQTSRRFAQALLEHLDAERVTKRLPDDSRVLRRG
jgi:hypothetical protein